MAKLETEQYFVDRLLGSPRPGEENILAFYDHGMDAIFTNPRLMVIPLDDHLVHRGDGVFEALRFENRAIYQLDEHLGRLTRSAGAIGLIPPVDVDVLRSLVFEVCQASRAAEGNVLIFCGRGPGGFTLDYRECPRSSLYIVAKRFVRKPDSFWTQGVSAMRTSIPAKQGWMSQIKSVNYLPNVLMKKDAIEHDADYPLCFDADDCLAEGSTENVVLVDAAGIFVVPELRNALTGTTLARAMDLMRARMVVATRPVPEEELYGCREIILLGTSLDAVGVVRYNGRVVGDGQPGPVAGRLRELLVADRGARATRF